MMAALLFLLVFAALASPLPADDVMHVEVKFDLGAHPPGAYDEELETPKWTRKQDGSVEPQMFRYSIELFPEWASGVLVTVQLLDEEDQPVELVDKHSNESTKELRKEFLSFNLDFFEEEWKRVFPAPKYRIFRLEVQVEGTELSNRSMYFVLEQK